MTKIWITRTNPDRYRSFGPTQAFFDKYIEWVDKFHEPKLLASEWPLVEMELYAGEPGKERKERKKPTPDFARGYIIMSCSERARLIIEPLVNGQVEFLPLITPVGTYYEMNIQRIECLDVEHSIVGRFKDGEIMRVEKYAFFWENLRGQHIFWVKELGKTPTFVSDAFKRIFEQNGLTGLEFFAVPLVE